MNAFELHKYEIKRAALTASHGPFFKRKESMYELMDACGGYPGVGDWSGSTLREWWDGCEDGWEMFFVLERCGVNAAVHPCDTSEEIRGKVTFEQFISAAELFIDLWNTGRIAGKR